MNVVVVGINYAPESTGIGPYTTSIAQHLTTLSHSVSVMTGVPHYPGWLVDDYYRRALRFRERGGDRQPHVIRLRHLVPRQQSAATRAGYELTFLANAITTPQVRRPDVVVAVTPSLGGAVVGALLARRHGAALLVVVQDLMGKAARQSGIRGGSAVSGITSALERWALRRADQVAVVSDAFRETVRRYGIPEERIQLMPNWTHITAPRQDRLEARRILGWRPDAFIVSHTGNMGLKQDLVNVVHASALLRRDVEVILMGNGSQRDVVQAAARRAGGTNIRFVEPLDDENYPLALAASDVLLVNERPSVGDMSLPSKLTSYLAASRPVVAAVSPDGATAAELARTNGACVLVAPGDPEALARAITSLCDDASLRRTMAAAGRRYAEASLGQDDAMRRLESILAATVVRRAQPSLPTRTVGPATGGPPATLPRP